MPEILRIETARAGEYDSVPFLWTTGAGAAGPIASLSRVSAPLLRLKKGTRQVSPLNESRLQETWVAFSQRGSKKTQREVNRLTSLFKLAIELQNRKDESDVVYLVEQMSNELSPRRSAIYSGSIAPLDHEVVGRDMKTGYSLWAITVERDIEWEYGDYQLTKSGGVEVNSHGGTMIMPLHFQSSGVDSRISTMIIRAKTSEHFKKVWMGIKPNRDGFDSFDPEIAIGDNTNKNSVVTMAEGTYYEYDTAYLSNAKIRVDYGDNNWKIRFRAPMIYWNLSTQQGNELVRSNYIGQYHLVGRYRTSAHSDAKYGVRVGTGWENEGSISWSDRLYINPSIAPNGRNEHRYVDYGIINIGMNLWSPDVRDRLVLGSFNIYVDSARVQGDNGSFGFDNMFLVPDNHFLYFNLDEEIAPDKRVELYTNQNYVTNGFVVNASGSDALGKPLSVPQSIYSTITDITSNNWKVPREQKSVMVLVGDRSDNFTKGIGSAFRVDFAIKRRTEGFAVSGLSGEG